MCDVAWLVGLLGATGVLICACNDERVCEPGSTQTCVCAGGLPGGQICEDGGSRWGDCDCGAADGDADSDGDADGDSGRTFHVSNEGSDDNDGSAEAPWATLERVNEQALGPGDSVLFERGSWFEGALVVTASGTEASPITLGAFGAGDEPALTNQDVTVHDGNVIRIEGSHIVVEGLFLYECAAADLELGVDARQIGAVYIAEGASHVVVRSCEIEDCPVGIQSYGEHNLLIDNYIHDCNRFLEEPDWGPIGIMIATSNHEVSYNWIENYVVVGGTFGADGGAIELDNEDYTHDDIEIHHNLSIGNQGFLEIIPGESSTRDVRVHHNLSDDFQQFVFFWSGSGCHVEHNTVLATRRQNSQARVVFSFGEAGNLIQNNIFVVAGGARVFAGENVYEADLYDEQDYSHNLYFCIDGSVADPIGLPPGVGDIVADPLFLDLEELDLHLEPASPAIDAAIDLGHSVDFDENDRVVGDAPDIGAFEFQG